MATAIIKTIARTVKSQRGFTLIELLAVLSIVAILAGIVTTGVTGQTAKGNNAAALQNANSTSTSAIQFFQDRIVDLFTTNTVTLTTTVSGATVSDVSQQITSRWPEQFISDTGSRYIEEFPTAGAVSASVLDNLDLVDSDGNSISGATFLATYTSVDFAKMIDGGYMDREPDGVSRTTQIGGIEFNFFLALFRKVGIAGESGTDSRSLVVFRLSDVKEDKTASKPLRLTYTQVY